MIDVNYPLQKAYNLLLDGITFESVAVPAYYQQIPDDINPDNYIIFSPITNVDGSAKTGFDTISFMEVKIRTHKSKYNEGKACGSISSEVLTRVYTKPSSLAMAGFVVVSTSLDSDTQEDFSVKGERVYVDRRLVFKHIIQQQ